ncbi:hypothetical protein ABT169_17470 [Streptomyces sp. NPDC001616]|uniref:hypothetical protein n=1 Tax=Streptomyces sp. NPDC001616 TaxID=3156648 RepID=UPI00331CC43C
MSQNSPTPTQQAPVTRAEFERLRTTVRLLIGAVLFAGVDFVIDLVREFIK